jgi:outer membrane PBP1 activator LpoA protein
MLRRHFLVLSLVAFIAELVATPVLAEDITLTENTAQTKPTEATAGPHIALVLPLDSTVFHQPADIVRQGFLAAANVQPDSAPIRVYASTDQVSQILNVYQQAIAQGARVVVGPLTKNAVVAIAASDLVTVPTLALSMPDHAVALPQNLYLFGLSIEEEARQVADLAARDERKKPLVVAANTQLAKRMQQAFADEWKKLGREQVAAVTFDQNGDLSSLQEVVRQDGPDMIFLAANAQESRAVRPYLSPMVPTYATSQTFGGDTRDPRNVDLGGIRFLDMPWLLEPDHPAVMIYPRPPQELGAELERLYALGIDALRLANLVYQGRAPMPSSPLDGVTGTIALTQNHIFQRQLVAAEFQQDSVVILAPGAQ